MLWPKDLKNVTLKSFEIIETLSKAHPAAAYTPRGGTPAPYSACSHHTPAGVSLIPPGESWEISSWPQLAD